MDVPTYHTGIALGRRARPATAVPQPAAQARSRDVAAALSGSSMRVMEASLAIVAIATAILLGIGR